MANTIELSQGGIDKLYASVDKLVDSMNKLEASVSKLARNNTNAFQKVFGSVEDFNRLTKAIKKLDVEGVDSFVKLTNAIKGVVSALNAAAQTPTAKLRNFAAPLTGLLETIASSKFSVGAALINLASIKKALSSLAEVKQAAADLGNIKVGNLKDIDAIIKVYKTLSDLQLTAVNVSPEVIKRISNIADAILQNAAKLANSVKTNINFTAITAKFLAIISLVEVLKKFSFTRAVLETAGSFFQQLGVFGDRVLKSLPSLAGIARLVESVGYVIKGIGDLFEEAKKALATPIPSTAVSNIGGISLLLLSLSGTLAILSRFKVSADAVQTLTAATIALRQVADNIKALTGTLPTVDYRSLANIGIVIGGLSVSLGLVLRFVLPKGAEDRLKTLSQAFLALADTFHVLAGINAQFGGVKIDTQSITAAINAIARSAISFRLLSAIKVDRILTPITQMLKAFVDFVRLSDAVGLAGIQTGIAQFTVFLQSIFAQLGTLSAAINVKDLLKVTVILPAFIGFGTAMGKVLDLFTVLRPVLAAIPGIGPLLGGAISSLAPIAGLATGVGDLGVFDGLKKTFTNLFDAVKSVSGIARDLKFTDIIKAFLSLQAVLLPIKGIIRLAIDRGAIESLAPVLNSVGNVISALGKLSKTAQSLTFTALIKVAAAMVVFGTLLRSIASSLQKSVSPESLTATAKMIASVGAVLTAISNIGTASTSKALQILPILKTALAAFAIVKLMVFALRGLSVDQAKAGAAVLRSISQFFSSINDLFISFQRAPKNVIKPVLDVFKSVSTIVKGFKNLKNVPSLDGVGDFFKGVTDLLTFVQSIDDVKTLKTQTVDILGAIIGKLKTLRFSKSDAAGLAGLGEVLKALPTLTQSGGSLTNTAQATGSSLGNSIRIGFSEAFGGNLYSIVKSAFLTLNPISLTKSFVDGVKSALAGMLNGVDAIIRRIQEAGQALITLGKRLKTQGINFYNNFGFGAVTGTDFFKAATEFDTLSASVRAFGNLTSDQLKVAQDFANQIGKDYPQSSAEALQGILNLQKAGLSLNQTFGALPAAADLSALTDNHNLDEASKAIILVTQQFQDFNATVESSFDNASVASDILARAANNSAASVESLVAGLENVGPVANSAGLNLEETTAVLGLFSNAGLDGAEAGTQLKSLLTNLFSGKDDVNAELKKLNVSLVDGKGNFRDINDIVTDLNKALNGTQKVTRLVGATVANDDEFKIASKAYANATRQILIYKNGLTSGALDADKAQKKIAELTKIQENAQATLTRLTGSQATAKKVTVELTRSQEQNFQAIMTLAGAYGQVGLNTLLAAGDDAIQNFILTTGRLPTASEQARIALDNLAGDVEQIKGSFETLGIRIILPLINRAFRPLVKLGRSVIDFFVALPDPIIDTISNGILLTTTLGTLGAGLVVAAGYVIQFGGVLLSAVGAVATMLVNLPLLIGLIGSFAVGIAAIISIAAPLAAIIAGAGAAITDFIKIINTNAGGAGDKLNLIKYTLNEIISAVSESVSSVGNIFKTIFGNDLGATATERGEKIANVFNKIYLKLLGLQTLARNARDFLSVFSDFLKGPDLAATKLAEFADAVGGEIGVDATNGLKAMQKAYDKTLATIGSSTLIQRVFGRTLTSNEILKIFDQLKTGLFEFKGAVLDVVSGVGGSLFNVLGISDDPAAAAKLTSGLSRLGGLFTRGLQSIFKISLPEALTNFDAGDLAGGAKALIRSFVSGLRTAISANKAKLLDIASTIFSFLLPGSFLLPRLIKALGFNKLGSAVQQVFNGINTGFRKVFGTLLDVLSGKSLQETLFGNFGKDAEPILRAFDALGETLNSIAGVISDLFSALFPQGLDTSNFLSDFFTVAGDVILFFDSNVITPLRNSLPAIVNVISSVLQALGTIGGGVLDFLGRVTEPVRNAVGDLLSGKVDFGTFVAGLPQTVATTVGNALANLPTLLGAMLTGLGDLFGSPLLTKLGEDIKAGDYATAIADLTTALLDTVNSAIASVPDLLINLGASFGAPILTKLGEGLNTGDFTGVSQTILDTVQDAISAVPGLLTDLGSIFSSPLLTKLGEDLSNADPTAIVKTITDTVAKVVQTALGSIPTRLQELGATLDLNFLKDLGLTLEQSDLFKSVVDTIGRLVALPLDTLGTFATSIGSIVDNLKKIADGTNPEGAKNLRDLAASLALIGGTFFLLGPLPAIVKGLSSIFGVIKGAAGSLVHFAGIAATLIIIKNAVSGLADVFSGKKDFGTAVGDFFFNIGKDALALFGVDKVFGVSIDEIKNRWDGLFSSLRIIAQVALQKVQDFLRNIVDRITVSSVLLQQQVNIASPDEATRAKAGAYFAVNDILGKADLTNSFQAIEGALSAGFSDSVVKAVARMNWQAFDNAFVANIANLQELSDQEFQGLISGLVASDRLDEAISKIPPDALAPFMKRLLNVSPETLRLLDFTQISGVLETAVQSGSLSIDVAKAFVYKIPYNILSPADKDAFYAQLLKDLGVKPDGTPAATEQQPTAEMPVDVKPVATVSDDAKLEFFNDATNQLGTNPPEPAEPVKVETPVAPQPTALEAAGITTPESAQTMANNLLLVQQQADLTTPSLATLMATSTLLSGILNALVNTALDGVRTRIDLVRTAATNLAAELPGKMAIVGITFVTSSLVAAAGLDPLITKLDTVKTKITEIANALAALKNGGVDPNSGSINIGVDGKRKDGGSVFAGKLYEVAEQGISELLQIGGKTFLIPGQNGTVIPPAAPPVQSARGSSSVVNNSSADNSIGSIQIIIQGGTNLTQEQLQNGVANGIKDYQRSKPLNKRLVLAGKT